MIIFFRGPKSAKHRKHDWNICMDTVWVDMRLYGNRIASILHNL